MLDPAVGHHDPVRDVPVPGLLRHAAEELSQSLAVLGMRPLEYELRRRLRRPIDLEDPVRFVGPHELAPRRPPPEARGLAEALSLGELSLRFAQVGIEPR